MTPPERSAGSGIRRWDVVDCGSPDGALRSPARVGGLLERSSRNGGRTFPEEPHCCERSARRTHGSQSGDCETRAGWDDKTTHVPECTASASASMSTLLYMAYKNDKPCANIKRTDAVCTTLSAAERTANDDAVRKLRKIRAVLILCQWWALPTEALTAKPAILRPFGRCTLTMQMFRGIWQLQLVATLSCTPCCRFALPFTNHSLSSFRCSSKSP